MELKNMVVFKQTGQQAGNIQILGEGRQVVLDAIN
jgi:hypothetical protein